MPRRKRLHGIRISSRDFDQADLAFAPDVMVMEEFQHIGETVALDNN